jgi:hypothetical protein
MQGLIIVGDIVYSKSSFQFKDCAVPYNYTASQNIGQCSLLSAPAAVPGGDFSKNTGAADGAGRTQ